MKKESLFTMRISEEDKNELSAIAEAKGLTLSSLMRVLYKEFLKKENEQKNN